MSAWLRSATAAIASPPGMSSGPCSALREPDPRSMPNRNRHVPRQPKPCRQHGGTGTGANRDIAVLWCDIAPPCASPPTAPPTERRTPARNPRFSTCSGLVCVRHGLSAGGNRLRTVGPALVKGLWAVADERCRTDKLDGGIKHRSARETTTVGRVASLDGRLFFGGTDGSNPVPSSGESGELPYCASSPR